MDAMERFVSVRGVVRRFGDVVAVDEADLDVPQGSLTALLGPSGCGKTTLLRLIGGLDIPRAGTIEVGGTLLTGPGAFVPPEKRHVVLVFQDFALFPHLDVGRNVGFGVPSTVDRRRRTRELLELVGLAGLEHRMPHELSGGQQQRVAIARALAAEPRLILLDEPFSNLDPSIRSRVRAEVQALIHQVGITAIFVTHDLDEAYTPPDRVAVMIGGKVLQTGTPREVYGAPATRAVAEFIGQPNFLPGEVRDGAVLSELGPLRVMAPIDGPVDVMVRSEQISPANDGADGVLAMVVESTYFGHEQSALLRLPSGATIRARWHAGSFVAPGDGVHIRVDGEARVFPRSPRVGG
jgi:iron(III) transport system ATP-binding protein